MDWRLWSLAPFDTEETLTVHLTDGEMVEIRVTDITVAGERTEDEGRTPYVAEVKDDETGEVTTPESGDRTDTAILKRGDFTNASLFDATNASAKLAFQNIILDGDNKTVFCIWRSCLLGRHCGGEARHHHAQHQVQRQGWRTRRGRSDLCQRCRDQR